MPMDGARLGVDYAQLTEPCQSLGVGGVSRDFQADAIVTFLEPGVALHAYAIQLLISTPSPDTMTIPSLLGRNIIDRWRIIYDPAASVLEAEVRSSDVNVPLTS